MNILLLNGGKEFGHSHGELNNTLHKKAKEVLTALGHNVKETVIDAGYDVEAEIEKFLWMDANTCFRLRGMRRLKRSPVKATSLKAKMWMLCTCLSTNSTSSSV